ncbi:hypothetical protein Dsin_007280 [Dipteronia sinensis]|uniref:PPM-type phosphatase domain-containing protein n=1 Tax=Dipteronia sinensis TaxID=43782 RepID=A0AAE0B0U1_9ROSI|nr:hypothetical protein Dsin_007280 [Dipteronia sinensis]
MGGCCSIDVRFGRYTDEDMEERGYYEYCEDDDDDDNGGEAGVKFAESGATVRFQGSSFRTSMFTQQGKKGINQDAMTVWERFTGERDTIFCGVFDGHGPSGHKISRYVRDNLPLKLSSSIKQLQTHNGVATRVGKKDRKQTSSCTEKGHDDHGNDKNHFFRSLQASIVQSFKEVDEELSVDSAMDGYCSGTTSVNVIKKGEHLLITNLGDSRAVLGTRDDKNQIVPVQLTVDLKPNLPNEAERIKNCRGRVFALDEEPDVYRIWMADEDCPGLAMARAFGDFCLKDYGLISVPEISYRKITSKDEFVVLASDGIWDVLSNNEVVKIVSCAKKRSLAAKLLVYRAVRTWKTKYPGSRIDDCAVVVLFLKNRQPFLNKSMSDVSCNSINQVEIASSHSCRSFRSDGDRDTILGNLKVDLPEDYSALKGDDVMMVQELNNKHSLTLIQSALVANQDNKLLEQEEEKEGTGHRKEQ